MAEMSRRTALGLLAGASVPPVAIAGAAPVVLSEGPHEKIRRLAWEIAHLLNGIEPHIDSVSIRSSAERFAVLTGFDIDEPPVEDPLLVAISDCECAEEAVEKNKSADEVIVDGLSETMCRAENVLCSWDRPATTWSSALAALDYAKKDIAEFGINGPAHALVTAALAFFKQVS